MSIESIGDGVPTERFANFRQPQLPRIREQPTIGYRTRKPPARVQRTRRTVDLSPATHRALDIWQRDAADRLGLARVTGQDVITALIEQLLVDPNLSAQIVQVIGARRV
ncbi:ATPase [Mycobacterium asiaticum]|uniref:ATPase n=1 Tax=Mycobacterium asiaticum TaxID=1790 RepID=UPI000AEBE2E0|nr:ATPase [Mycobacterium asiaticum]